MRNLSLEEKTNLLAMIFWDKEVSPVEIFALLEKPFDDENFRMEKIRLYRRLLMSFDWYVLLKLVPPNVCGKCCPNPCFAGCILTI